jgi:hypothetical protein
VYSTGSWAKIAMGSAKSANNKKTANFTLRKGEAMFFMRDDPIQSKEESN